MRPVLPCLMGIAFSAGCASTIELELVTLTPATIIAAERAQPPAEVVAAPAVVVPAPPVAREVVKVDGDQIALEEKIQFTAQSAKLSPASYALLDEVAKLLHARTDIQRVEIRGHTAHMGRAKRSFKLSIERASAVREYLIKKGIAERRLIAKGLGASIPVAENSSEVGREKNRRVELLIRASPKVALAEGAKQ